VAELGIVHLAQRVLHVASVGELHHATALAVHVGVDHVACLAHKILEVLPAARLGQAGNDHAELGSAADGAAPTAAGVASASAAVVSAASVAVAAAAASAAVAIALGELHAESASVVLVAVSASDCVLGIAGVVEGDEAEGRGSNRGLQVDLSDSAILVEQIVDLGLSV
jgi:hypothetical protein